MKFNLKMFRNVLPKKSVLKKNKWVLVILALVILVGLYWYSKKSQENYYNSKGNNAPPSWGGPTTLKKDLAGNVLPPERLDEKDEQEKTDLLRFANHISGIRDVFYKVQNKNSEGRGPESTDMYCTIERKKGTSTIGEGVINLNDYGTFIDLNQKDTLASSIWTGTNGVNQEVIMSGDCQEEYKNLFTNHQTEINTELQIVDAQINQAGIADDEEPVYIDEIIHEQVTLYLGNTGCNASTNFLNKIWTNTSYTNANNDPVKGENLRQEIIKKFPGIELDETTRNRIDVENVGPSPVSKDIIRCEHTSGDAEGGDLSATTNLEICKLAGFYAVPTDKKLSFPLIQYSFLGKTNKDRDNSEVGYTRYTSNFDPTKKLVPDDDNNDDNGKKMVDDKVDGVTKPVYTSQKIIDWLSDLRGN